MLCVYAYRLMLIPDQIMHTVLGIRYTFSSRCPRICVLCHANSESNDQLFIHCPFTWQLWEKLYRLMNLNWVVTNNTHTFISQWRTTPLSRKAKKIWNLSLHACAPFERKGIGDFLKTSMGIHLQVGLFLVSCCQLG